MVKCFKTGFLIAWLCCITPRAHGATIMFLSQTASFDPATDQVTFTIEFNRLPDFFATDSVGRQANSFQYFVLGDLALQYPAAFDSIVRGEEIHIANSIRIRNAVPSVSDPAAGGWGAIRDVVPFSLSGSLLSFSAPLASLSDRSVDGRFSYRLEVYSFGGLDQFAQAETTVVPEPGMLVNLSLGLTALLIYRFRRPRTTGTLKPVTFDRFWLGPGRERISEPAEAPPCFARQYNSASAGQAAFVGHAHNSMKITSFAGKREPQSRRPS